MCDHVYIPHFGVPLERQDDYYLYANETASIVARPADHGWELRFAVSDGARFAIVVEGRTLAEAEGALERAIGSACDALSAALMQVSTEARHG